MFIVFYCLNCLAIFHMGKFQQQHVECVNADFTKMAELLFEKVSPSSNGSVASVEAAVRWRAEGAAAR